jgi:predicted adenine nucleotide alpha hydrolase (AANH) superfamily ATPase
MSDRKILVHGCCAHCTAYTVEYWRQAGLDVSVLWYNPNVHPFTEHQNRLEAMKTLADRMDFPLIVAEGYDIIEYFRRVNGHEDDRCCYCFELRLNRTAATAAELGIPAFSTSLLISPHQKHELIPLCGELAATHHGVNFLYADLRKRYSDSRHITKPMELYRQQYCGCLFSEWERYAEPTPPHQEQKP